MASVDAGHRWTPGICERRTGAADGVRPPIRGIQATFAGAHARGPGGMPVGRAGCRRPPAVPQPRGVRAGGGDVPIAPAPVARACAASPGRPYGPEPCRGHPSGPL